MENVEENLRLASAEPTHFMSAGAIGAAVKAAVRAEGALVREVFQTLWRSCGVEPFGPYWALLDSSRELQLVGIGGFKGSPDESGAVEIAYFTLPAFEGLGVATALAGRLVRLAHQGGAVTIVAHTLPKPGPSTRVLEANGFVLLGSTHDPEDGVVWCWKRG